MKTLLNFIIVFFSLPFAVVMGMYTIFLYFGIVAKGDLNILFIMTYGTIMSAILFVKAFKEFIK